MAAAHQDPLTTADQDTSTDQETATDQETTAGPVLLQFQLPLGGILLDHSLVTELRVLLRSKAQSTGKTDLKLMARNRTKMLNCSRPGFLNLTDVQNKSWTVCRTLKILPTLYR